MSKIIIAGSRRFPSLSLNSPSDWKNTSLIYPLLCNVITQSKLKITTVISGCAWGMDSLGEIWAANNNIPVIKMPADWSIGKRAGFLRNYQMAKAGDALICICTPGSAGSTNMIETMSNLRKPVFFQFVE